jgi:hypothetical protein
MADANFRHGDPIMIDYTPAAGDVAAGQVVLIGNTAGLTCGVSHRPITNNVQGALAMGGGIYEMVNLNNAAVGTKVWWDNTAKKVTTTSTSNALFGFVVERGGGGANTVCDVYHFPFV